MYSEIFSGSEEKSIEDILKRKDIEEIMPALNAARFQILRRKISEEHIESLKESKSENSVFVPFIFAGDGGFSLSDLFRISSQIKSQLLGERVE